MNAEPVRLVVTGIGDRYAVNLHRPDGKVRIGRDVEPVPVGAEERADAEERATRGMRRTDPEWRWNGEPIPQTKPAFRALIAARDGRIWVQRYVPAVRTPWTAEEERNARDPQRALPPRFREPVVFDVFELEGRYVGEVNPETAMNGGRRTAGELWNCRRVQREMNGGR